VFLKFIVYNFY